MIPIILSTACYHDKYEKVIDAAIRAIKPSHNINGIELSLLTKNECLDFEINYELSEYSKKDNLIFIHAPAKSIVYLPKIESNKVLHRLKCIYDELGAKNIVFHCENIISMDYLISEMKGYNISIENPDAKMANSKYFETIENNMNNYPVNLTLDVEHARNDLPKFLKKGVVEKICEIHYSNYNPVFNHDSYNAVIERFHEIISAIKVINKPVVVEIDLRNDSALGKEFIKNSREIISKEIELLRNNLK